MFPYPNNPQSSSKSQGQSQPSLSYNNYGHRSDKSFDDLSKSSMSLQASNNRPYVESNRNFKVMVRVRPPLPRELESSHFLPTVQVSSDHKKIMCYEYYNIDSVDPSQLSEYAETTNMYTLHSFTFDYVFDQDSTQIEVYETTAKPAVMSVLEGYNATILAYGQTGTGKTFTMEGFKYNNQDPQRGMVPRSMEEIFRYIENVSNSKTTFMVRASYLQIYNEVISDLLRTERVNLHIREDKKKGMFVEGLSEWAVRSPSDIYSLIQKGALSRATASTKMNDVSSRSHAVFIIIVEQMSTPDDIDEDVGREIRVGKLNLVDLAGSERVRVTGATGKRLEESKKINQSLSALGNVISALTDHKQMKTHIPYRDSKITRLLEDSLGGNCITTMMAMVSPVMEAFAESLSSLKFANRAKNIKNDPIINEDIDQRALLRKYEMELGKLRAELNERNKHNNPDKSSVTQLEEDKRRAERDKVAAVEALEIRSREYMQEREEKKKLEEKIRAMYSQVLQGGKKIEDTPQFRNALEEQQKLIREQYEKRMQDFEKERQILEEDKAQVDKYKQLLLKQRDIMIALTTRLNERDETIVQLQEELDAYDRIHRESEGLLELKIGRVDQLENVLREQNLPIPPELNNNEFIEAHGHGHNNFYHGIQGNNSQGQKLYPQYNAETVQYDGQETYNVPQNEMLTAEEKVSEMTQIADGQRNEILRLRNELAELQNASETSGFLKHEINALNDRVQQQQRDPRLLATHQEIKSSIDSIIDSLSSQNEPQKLQNVARELLSLQKLVNSLNIEQSPNLRVQQSQSDKPPSFSNAGPNDYQDLKKKAPAAHRHSASASRSQEERPGPNFSKDHNKASGHLHQSDLYAQNANADENPLDTLESSEKPQGAFNKASNMRHMFENRPLDRQRAEMQSEEMVNANMNLGGVKNLNPERKPMTVEEMLRLKRGDLSKKK